MEPQGSTPNVGEDLIGSATTAGEIIGALAKRGCSDLTCSIDLGACSDLPRGGGGFCDIYRGALRGGTKIAIKSLRIYEGSEADGDTERRKVLKRAARELYHWSKLQHRNVLPLMGLATFRGQISMISEWMDNGNLVSFLRLNPDADRNRLCIDVCEGLCHIHMNGMVHGDLKAANVVVSSCGTAMIADFGNAQLNDLTLKFTGTTKGGFSVRWAAPELLLADGGPQVSKEADVYAYGMTVLEALTGKMPYEGISDNRILILVAVEKKIPSRPDVSMSDGLWDLLNLCWAHEPTERPEITHVRDSLQTLFWPSSDTGSIEGSASHSTSSEHKPDVIRKSGNAHSTPSLGTTPATPVTPPNLLNLRFQEIMRQREAELELRRSRRLSGSQSSNDRGSQIPSPTASETRSSTRCLSPQSQWLATGTLPSLSDAKRFSYISGPRPALDAIPAGASNLRVYNTRSPRQSDPPLTQWEAGYRRGDVYGVPLHMVADLNVGMGGSIWDYPVDPRLGTRSDNEATSGYLRAPELVQRWQAFASPDGSLAPPSMSLSSSSSSDLGEGGVGPRRQVRQQSGSGSHRVSPYHSPNHSPHALLDDYVGSGGVQPTKPVEHMHVTTPTTGDVGSSQPPSTNFKCPVPGCNSAFTRHFNLRGHLRSHNEERPFKCKWPGCDKGFARQHDCKRHEALHLNIRPYTCEGCQKGFARMDALNRHLQSEGGIECRKVQGELATHLPEDDSITDWLTGSGDVVV